MLKDYLGREIKVGDTVCYPVRRGSDMRLTTILVESVGNTDFAGRKKGRLVRVRNLNNCLVIE